MAYQNSPYENYAEAALGVSLGVWLAGNFAEPLFKLCDKSESNKVPKEDFFGPNRSSFSCSGILNSFVLFVAFPWFITIFFVAVPGAILLVSVLQESTIFHEEIEQANVGHYLGEGFFFCSIYFICLSMVTFSFPLIQSRVYDKWFDESGADTFYSWCPAQYQDRVYTAAGYVGLSSYFTFLLLTKINSTDFMNQEDVDTLLIAAIIMPFTMLIRGQPFIKGFYFFLPVFEFNEIYAGLFAFILVQYGGLIAMIYLIGSVLEVVLYPMIISAVLFILLPKVLFLLKSHNSVKIFKSPKSVTTFSTPVRKALFDGADVAVKDVVVQYGQELGGYGLKCYVLAFSGGFPTFLSGYYTRLSSEIDLSSHIRITRRLKRFNGIFALPSVLVAFSLVLPLLFFFRSTKIKYYNEMNALSELKEDKDYKMWVSTHFGRSVQVKIYLFDRSIIIVDSPGIEASFSYYIKTFDDNSRPGYSPDPFKPVFFLWKCSSFMDVMMVVKFLQDYEIKLKNEEQKRKDVPKPNFLICCDMTEYKFWAIRDLVDGKEGEYIKDRMMIGQKFSIESLKPDLLFVNQEVKEPQDETEDQVVDAEAQETSATEVVDTTVPYSGEENEEQSKKPRTAVISIGSSALRASVRPLVPRLGNQYFDVIFEHSITEQNAWDPNGFFQVG